MSDTHPTPTIIQHTGPTPYKKRDTDAGWDLRALTATTLKPRKPTPITLATRVNLPTGTHAKLTARSSLAARGVLEHQGTIDTGYTGPLKLIATNMTDKPIHLRADERVAQLVIHPTNTIVEWEWVHTLPQTPRGNGGFGSTGTGNQE